MVLGQHATFDSQSRSYKYKCASGGFQGFKTLETLCLPLPLPVTNRDSGTSEARDRGKVT